MARSTFTPPNGYCHYEDCGEKTHNKEDWYCSAHSRLTASLALKIYLIPIFGNKNNCAGECEMCKTESGSYRLCKKCFAAVARFMAGDRSLANYKELAYAIIDNIMLYKRKNGE